MPRSVVRRVYALDGGSLNIEQSMLILGEHCGTRVDVPVPLYLLDTSVGYVLVDTGNDPGVIEDPVGTWGSELATAIPPRMTPENHPYRQLELLGVQPRDVRLVVYTHLHHDHAGGARLFTHAPQVVQRAEYRWAMHPDRFSERIYRQSDFDCPDIDWRLLDGDCLVLPGVQVLCTPGHTPGHQSLVLWDVPDVGTTIIAGDAIYRRENVVLDVPPAVTTSAEDALRSMRSLVTLAEAVDGTLLVNHEAEFFALLERAPEPLRRMSDEQRRYWAATKRPVRLENVLHARGDPNLPLAG